MGGEGTAAAFGAGGIATEACRGRRRLAASARAPRRGVTLVEVLLTVAIIALLTGMILLGRGVRETARLKRSAVMIAGAVRVAYAHASATSKTVRLVFDFQNQRILLEESSDRLFLAKKDRTGGAAAATELERSAQAEAEEILKGPRAPRPSFQTAKAFGFAAEEEGGRPLPEGIRFVQVETPHFDEPEKEDRAYLYFWPGGLTERAAIQVTKGGSDATDADALTILVSPLTGKAEIKAGRADLPRPRDEREESEREDGAF